MSTILPTTMASDIEAMDSPLPGQAPAPGDTPQKDPKDERKERALTALVQQFDMTGQEERIWQLAEIQRGLMLWHGESGLYWDERQNSWMSIWDAYEDGLVEKEDIPDYDKDINFYRPLLESVIAASCLEIPRILFVPAKASDPMDITTAREATKVSSLIDTQNDAKKLLFDAHFILANQHFVAGYTYYEEDGKKYGTDIEDVTGVVDRTRQIETCPNCALDMTDVPPADPTNLYKYCQDCDQLVEPQPEDQQYQEEAVTGQQEYPKGRVVVQVYGPVNIRLPHYIKTLSASPFLVCDEEQSVALLADLYSEKFDEIMSAGTAQTEKYDRWAREPVTSIGATKSDRATHRRIWFRSWAFNFIPDKETRDQVKQEYPDGALATYVNDIFIRCTPSSLDTHWDITETAFAETIHDDPGGKILIPIIEMQNDLLQFWLECIKHNIPETFIDSGIIDMEKYSKVMARPGMRTPVKRPAGQNLEGSFHETRTVSISQESLGLYRIAEQVGQFASKAMPSIFGGFLHAGSRTTAFEYDASRQAALQRVALNLGIVNSWWARLKLKGVKLYKENAKRPEEYSAKAGTSYRPVTINPENLQGNLDNALPEASSAFPTTWSQKRDFFVQGLQSNNPQLIQLIFHPENTTLLKELIGIPELYVPGEPDRLKQLREISELLQGAPIQGMGMMDPATGMPTMTEEPSIMPDPRTDNGPAHIITCQAWLNSDDGWEAEKNNPEGYKNVILHLTEHFKLMPPPQEPQPGGPGGEAPKGPGDVPPPSPGPGSSPPPQGAM